jgi:hypothetical protein
VKSEQMKRTEATLPMLLHSFNLTAFEREYASLAERAAAEGLSHPESGLSKLAVREKKTPASCSLGLVEETRQTGGSRRWLHSPAFFSRC